MDESFITPELQSRIGVAGEPVTVDVTPVVVRRVGETLTAFNRLVDLSERFGSRLGQTLAVRHEWQFTDAAGETVAFARRSMAYYRSEEMPRREERPEGPGTAPVGSPPMEP